MWTMELMKGKTGGTGQQIALNLIMDLFSAFDVHDENKHWACAEPNGVYIFILNEIILVNRLHEAFRCRCSSLKRRPNFQATFNSLKTPKK